MLLHGSPWPTGLVKARESLPCQKPPCARSARAWPVHKAMPARTLDSGEAGRVHTVQGMHGWRVACKERACLEQAVEGSLALV